MFISLNRAYGKFTHSVASGLLGLALALGVSSPAQAGPPLFSESASHRVEYGSLETNWGYGARENAYNDLITAAISEHWTDLEHPLDPMMFKALIAVESAFDTNAYSRTGCAGLVQLAPDTARRFGLSLHPVDERLNPHKAIPVGVQVLAEKHKVVLEPQNYFAILLGKPEKKCPYGTVVHQHYQTKGTPGGDDLFFLDFASFNGGGGTIMRAMAKAVQMGKDPLDWNSLVGTGPHDSPLYEACRMIYRHGAPGKYKEMRDYPRKIYKLLGRQGGAS